MCSWEEYQGIPSPLSVEHSFKLPEPNCGFGEDIFFPLAADRVQSSTTRSVTSKHFSSVGASPQVPGLEFGGSEV